jgi:hypothetical protein
VNSQNEFPKLSMAERDRRYQAIRAKMDLAGLEKHRGRVFILDKA